MLGSLQCLWILSLEFSSEQRKHINGHITDIIKISIYNSLSIFQLDKPAYYYLQLQSKNPNIATRYKLQIYINGTLHHTVDNAAVMELSSKPRNWLEVNYICKRVLIEPEGSNNLVDSIYVYDQFFGSNSSSFMKKFSSIVEFSASGGNLFSFLNSGLWYLAQSSMLMEQITIEMIDVSVLLNLNLTQLQAMHHQLLDINNTLGLVDGKTDTCLCQAPYIWYIDNYTCIPDCPAGSLFNESLEQCLTNCQQLSEQTK